MVRELVGPIAAFRMAAAVKGLPRTRSGKVCRKSISDLSRNKEVRVRCIFFNKKKCNNNNFIADFWYCRRPNSLQRY